MSKKILIWLGAIFLIIFLIIIFLGIIGKNKDSNIQPGPIPPIDSNQTTFNLGPGNYEFTLEHDGLTRYYKVYVPSSYDKYTKTPVVIYLHGGGGSRKAAYKDRVDSFSDKYGFIMIVPEGTGPVVLGTVIGSWNAGDWEINGKIEKCCGYAEENSIDDVGFLSKMIDEIKKNFNVDEKRVYSTGISNGGIMSYTLACEIADKISAVASVAPPGTPKDCSPSRNVSVMHIHGTADPCVPYNGGISGGCLSTEKREMQSAKKMVDIWRGLNSCLQNYQTVYSKGQASCVNYQNCKNSADVQFCTVQGMGHTYPSGNQYLSTRIIGPVSYDISFDQIWEFFNKHPMN